VQCAGGAHVRDDIVADEHFSSALTRQHLPLAPSLCLGDFFLYFFFFPLFFFFFPLFFFFFPLFFFFL
jgi:hypothetical protein